MSTQPKVPTMSFVDYDKKILVEQVYDPATMVSAFEAWSEGEMIRKASLTLPNGIMEPVIDQAIYKGIITLPSCSEPYGNRDELLKDIQLYLSKRVLLKDEDDYIFLSLFVLYTWLFDRLDTAPGLHITGDLGMGKSRLLRLLRLLTYRTYHSSGASSLAMLFRPLGLMDGGTCTLEEFDMDSRSEVDRGKMELLRLGFERGNFVGRCQGDGKGKQSALYFNPFGPKIITSRQPFPDSALDSRLYKIEMPSVGYDDITDAGIDHELDLREAAAEALVLRNKMLRFRQEHFFAPLQDRKPPRAENRIVQVLTPMYKTVVSDDTEEILTAQAERLSEEVKENRAYSTEGAVLFALGECWESLQVHGRQPILNHAITEHVKANRKWTWFTDKKCVAALRRLGLTVLNKRDGLFVDFDPTEHAALYETYNLMQPMYVNFGSMGNGSSSAAAEK